MARSDCLAIVPTWSASVPMIQERVTYCIVFGDSTFGDDSGSFDHDTTPSSHSHTSKMNKVMIGSMSIIGRV